MYRGLGLAGRGNFLYNISVEERCGMQKIKQDEINIGANIREIRLSRGIGQTELVRMVQLQGVDMTRESSAAYSTYKLCSCALYATRWTRLTMSC